MGNKIKMGGVTVYLSSVWALALSAKKANVCSTGVAYCYANTQLEAENLGLHLAIEKTFPESEGWSNHQVLALKIE